MSAVESLFYVYCVWSLPLRQSSGGHVTLIWWLVHAVDVQKILSSLLIATVNLNNK
jgi:hypothetical protein